LVLAFAETHFPNAFDLFAFVPYFALKAAGSAFCSVLQALAAAIVALWSATSALSDLDETHFPNPFERVLFVP